MFDVGRTYHSMPIHALEYVDSSSPLTGDWDKATGEGDRVWSHLRVILKHQVLPLSRSQSEVNSLTVVKARVRKNYSLTKTRPEVVNRCD